MVVEPIVEPRMRRETSKFCFFPLSLTFPIVAEMIFLNAKINDIQTLNIQNKPLNQLCFLWENRYISHTKGNKISIPFNSVEFDQITPCDYQILTSYKA